MRRRAAVLLAASLGAWGLLGCEGSILRARMGREEPPDEPRFTRKGYWTEEEFLQDRRDCKRQVRDQTVEQDATYPMQPGSTADSLRRYRACMETLGWKEVRR